MKDRCVESKLFWNTKRMEAADESSKSANSKKDAMALVTGKPVFMDDLVPKDCLIVKLLRSPHANAIIKEINKTAAEKYRELKQSIPGKMFRSSVLLQRDRPIRKRHLMIV